MTRPLGHDLPLQPLKQKYRTMSNKTKLKIGEFSKMMQVTVKTLRHYEQKGLLLPDEVDEWTGYRYYSIDQMQRLQAIRDLQRLGFSLDEIKELFEDDSHTPDIQQMDEKIKETEKQLKQLIARRAQGTLHEACRSLRAFLRVVHRGLPLYRRVWLQGR